MRTALMLCCTLLCMMTSVALAGVDVEIREGNVYLFGADGAARRLTTSGDVSSVTESPDGCWLAYVTGSEPPPGEPAKGPPAEIWLASTAVSGEAPVRLVATSHAAQAPQDELSGFTDLNFSPDSRTLYFMSQAWATSGAIHAVDLATKVRRFVVDGNTLRVVKTGQYAGDLLVVRHKYYAAGGSYDFIWLVSPQGKELMNVGDSDEAVETFLQLYR